MSSRPGLPGIAPYAMPAASELPASRATWELDPARVALLVHDLQLYFLRVFTPDAEPLQTLLGNVATLIQTCRKAGIPVFYTAQKGNQDRRDRGLQADLWGPGMSAIAEHETIHPAVAPTEGDFVLTKHRYSAFQRSNLETMMRARGRDRLMICGVYAHIGCMMTAAEAFQRDIQPFFIADALADFSREHHDAALLQVARSCGVVAPAQSILDHLT
jgi:bifunctional isochorismate lyase/aryl carrier protein